MKKLLFIAFFSISVFAATAQKRTVSAKDTLTNIDTSYIAFNSIANDVVGLQATGIKISGTVSANVFVQGTIDGIAWINLDTLAMANSAGYQTSVFTMDKTYYNSYRTACITTGTQSFSLTFSVLRRPEEDDKR